MDFRYVPTTCPYCGTGCGVNLVVRDGKVAGISPWHRSPVNEGRVCIRGNKSHEFVNSPARITTPLVRKGDGFSEASWEDAIREIAGKLGSAGADEVGFIASGRTCNEDNYVFAKLAREVIKTPNLDYCGRQCNAGAVGSLAEAFGNAAMTNSIRDLTEAKCILVAGSNPLEDNPLAGRRIIMAKKKGAKVIVADPRFSATARLADLYIACNPGTETALVAGIINAVIGAGKEDKEFVSARTKDFETCRESVSAYDAESVARTCGIDAADVGRAAELFAAEKPAAIVVSAGTASGDLVRACANLQLATGNIGKPGAGIGLLRAKANGQGATDVGCVPAANGMHVPEMLRAAGEGKIKALYIMGANPAAGGAAAADALGRADFLVVQDLFMTETAQKAHVVLPSAAFAERDGTQTNSERRIQRVRKAVEPAGSVKADWQIVCELATALGAGKDFAFRTAEEIFSEIVNTVPAYAGITYAALDRTEAIQWPAAGGAFGTEVLYADRFGTKDGKAAFTAVTFSAVEAPVSEYPFAVAAHAPMDTLSRNTESVVREKSPRRVALNAEDAKSLGFPDGTPVKVTGKNGSADLVAEVTAGIKKGVVAMPALFDAGAVKIEKTTGGD